MQGETTQQTRTHIIQELGFRIRRSGDELMGSAPVTPEMFVLAEEALLSCAPGHTLSSLAMRYLQPVRVGPAVASAQVQAGLGRAEVRDQGNGDRLAVVAVGRTLSV